MCEDFYLENDIDSNDKMENIIIPANIEDPFDSLAMAYNIKDEKINEQSIKEHLEMKKKETENKLLKDKKEKQILYELDKKKEAAKKKNEKKGRMIPKNTTKFIDYYDDYYQ
jgi:homoserine kinase